MVDAYGIDVSSYNGSIDFRKVKNAGIDFAILKIIRKDLNKDKMFETYYGNCVEAGLAVSGVYNYTYATTVAKAITDAKAVVAALAGRKLMVWLDVEDKCMQGLGYDLIHIINAYAEVIEKAGLKFGVYTGQYFYNTYIKNYLMPNYPLWIASYGLNTGKPQAKKRPSGLNVVGWQYSSKGKVNGISGNVDLNVWYANPATKTENPYIEPTEIIKKGSKGEGAKWVQWQLNYNGYSLIVDGDFGKLSDKALRNFQKASGLLVDGKCGKLTRAALKK